MDGNVSRQLAIGANHASFGPARAAEAGNPGSSKDSPEGPALMEVVTPANLKLSVVIPVFNEERWVGELLRRVLESPLVTEVIVVDDGSTDGTRSVLREFAAHPEVRVLYQGANRGKGAALREGFRHATGNVLLVQDADLEYDPAEYPRLLQPILDNTADVVYGSRFLERDGRSQSVWFSLGNRLLTCWSNLLTGLRLTDMETCFKVFRREVLEGMVLRCNRFGFEPEVTAKIAKKRTRAWRIQEVSIGYFARSYAQGKKIGVLDAFAAVYYIALFSMTD